MRAFSLTVSTIMVLIVLLITASLIILFFGESFTTGTGDISSISGTLSGEEDKLTGEAAGHDQPLDDISNWANPFGGS